MPQSNVDQHNRLDLDQKAMEVALKAGDWESAWSVYAKGAGNSMKSSGPRTIRGFSTSAAKKLANEHLHQVYKSYYGTDTYADDIITAAINGTGFMTGAKDIARVEVAKKGTAYIAILMYAVHEMEDAIGDCLRGNLKDNDMGVHAWDEAVAFYTGTLEGTDVGGDSAGVLAYRLAEKRCANFNVCGCAFTNERRDADTDIVYSMGETSGVSKVNCEMFEHFKAGRAALTSKSVSACDDAARHMNAIKRKMAIPLIQGSLRYAYLDPAVAPSAGAKQRAEGYIFSQAVLPQIDQCSPDAAAIIAANMDINAPVYVKDGHLAVFEAYHVLPCLGITCDELGGYLMSGSGESAVYVPGTSPAHCLATQQTSPDAAAPKYAPIAGYEPGSNVVPHNMIDLDQKELVRACKAGDFAEARKWYASGGNSKKSGNRIRTLQGFSTGAPGKLAGEPYYEIYSRYYGSKTYADDYVQSAGRDGNLCGLGSRRKRRGSHEGSVLLEQLAVRHPRDGGCHQRLHQGQHARQRWRCARLGRSCRILHRDS